MNLFQSALLCIGARVQEHAEIIFLTAWSKELDRFASRCNLQYFTFACRCTLLKLCAFTFTFSVRSHADTGPSFADYINLARSRRVSRNTHTVSMNENRSDEGGIHG
jgi:hypothetical protein